MNHDPEVWAVLGRAIRSDRERQGLTREQLAERVHERGLKVSTRSIGSLEKGIPPKKRDKPSTLEPVVAALGWQPGWTDRILAGEDPGAVLQYGEADTRGDSPRAQLLELVPTVYEFSRTAARLGAPAQLRDDFDHLVQQLLDSTTATQSSRATYGLAAYRPHAEGEGVPADDAARIRDALNR
jgi:transcriptional regulator with XRE-family HTH domain